jgi:hypothetical protein
VNDYQDTFKTWALNCARDVPADVADHETNIEKYRAHVASWARHLAFVIDKDFSRDLWEQLVEYAEDYLDVKNGADLELKYGIPNTQERREIALDGIQDELNWTSDRLVESMKDF